MGKVSILKFVDTGKGIYYVCAVSVLSRGIVPGYLETVPASNISIHEIRAGALPGMQTVTN